MLKRSALLTAALTVILSQAFPASGQNAGLDAWLREDPRAKAYAPVAAEIRTIFQRAQAEGLPLGILMDKLREGASKAVPADRLTAGLEGEAGRLAIARDILSGLGVSIPDRPEYEETLKDISLALLAGIPAGTVEALFVGATASGRPPRDARAACATLIRMASVTRLTEDELLMLGEALVSSSLSSSAFASIPSFFVKARASGLRESEVLDTIVVKVLRSGGGLARMEEMMNLRRKGG